MEKWWGMITDTQAARADGFAFHRQQGPNGVFEMGSNRIKVVT